MLEEDEIQARVRAIFFAPSRDMHAESATLVTLDVIDWR